MKDLIHFAQRPLDSVQSVERSAQSVDDKPKGLWVSIGPAWAEWCLAESFCLSALTHVNHVELSPSAKILRVVGARALDKFTKQYGVQRFPQLSYQRLYIDWRAVAERYDGIIIAPYVYSRRYTLDWYYGWDVASGCIWNASAISKVDCVAIVPPSEALSA